MINRRPKWKRLFYSGNNNVLSVIYCLITFVYISPRAYWNICSMHDSWRAWCIREAISRCGDLPILFSTTLLRALHIHRTLLQMSSPNYQKLLVYHEPELRNIFWKKKLPVVHEHRQFKQHSVDSNKTKVFATKSQTFKPRTGKEMEIRDRKPSLKRDNTSMTPF